MGLPHGVIRRGEISVLGRPTKAFVVEDSRLRLVFLAALSAAWAIISLQLFLSRALGLHEGGPARYEPFWPVTGLGALLFTGFAVVLAMGARRPTRYALTPYGVHSQTRFGAGAFAPWDAILGIRRRRASGAGPGRLRPEYLMIDVGPPAVRGSGPVAWLDELADASGLAGFTIETGSLGSRSVVLERAIRHYLANREARERIGTDAELERLIGAIDADRGTPSPTVTGSVGRPVEPGDPTSPVGTPSRPTPGTPPAPDAAPQAVSYRPRYTVIASRAGETAWRISILELPGGAAVALSADEIEPRARRRIAFDTNTRPDAFDLDIRLVPAPRRDR